MNITVERALQLIGEMKVENALQADQIATLQNQLVDSELKRAAAQRERDEVRAGASESAPFTESSPG